MVAGLTASMQPACSLYRFALLYDGRCLTAQAGVHHCGVSLEPCAAAGEPNATLQSWRLDGASHEVHSPAKEVESDGGYDPKCTDAAVDCASWAAAGECASNPTYMRSECRKSCGVCSARQACTMWGQSSPARGQRATDGDPVLAMGLHRAAPMLSLVSNRTRPRSRLKVEVATWSHAWPSLRFLRTECPAVANTTCCLESGLWSLGPRNALVKRALWHLCSFHEAHMFPFQQWRVECAPEAAATAEAASDGGAAAADETADATSAWLQRLVDEEGLGALDRLLPYELLGVGEFASAEQARLAFRRLSRHFHPDKNPSAAAKGIFDGVRAALEAFKDGSWRTKGYNDDGSASRFFTDASITELNVSAHAAALESHGPLWLIIYFAPWCHQCLANKAFFSLAARRLRERLGDERVRVGAFRCGVPRVANGFCVTEFNIPEHPTFRAVAAGFASELEPSMPQPLLPELLVNFTVGAELQLRRQREHASRVPNLTLAEARSDAFVASPQLVVFVSDGNECVLCAAARSAAAALDGVINVSVAMCRPPAQEPKATAPGNTPGKAAAAAAAEFDHTEYPSDAQQAVMQKQSQAFANAMRRMQEDAEWFGEGDDEGEEDTVAEGGGGASARAALRESLSRQQKYGERIWQAVRSKAPIAELEALLDQAEAPDREAALWRETSVHAASLPARRSLDWQQRGSADAYRGHTALLLASALGSVEAARLLLERGACAALPVPLLLPASAGVSSAGVGARTAALPWAVAVEAGQLELASLFRARVPGYLAEAIEQRESGTAEALLELCARLAPQEGEGEGWSAAEEEAEGSEWTEEEAEEWTATCRAMVNGEAASGGRASSTPLAMVTLQRDLHLAGKLLGRGADANAPSADGLRPLHWASMLCHPELVARLLQGGAVVGAHVGRGAGRRWLGKRGAGWDAWALLHVASSCPDQVAQAKVCETEPRGAPLSPMSTTEHKIARRSTAKYD